MAIVENAEISEPENGVLHTAAIQDFLFLLVRK
jgi:hypothetical protein